MNSKKSPKLASPLRGRRKIAILLLPSLLLFAEATGATQTTGGEGVAGKGGGGRRATKAAERWPDPVSEAARGESADAGVPVTKLKATLDRESTGGAPPSRTRPDESINVASHTSGTARSASDKVAEVRDHKEEVSEHHPQGSNRIRGTINYSDGVYEGEVLDGKPHGRGTLKLASGDMYDGEYQGGKRHGKGVFTWADGKVYDGEYRDGKEHGKGVYTWASGEVYDGEWRDGKAHGKGAYTRANGDVYDGEWKDGKQHGKGVYTWANGEVYDGEWRDGKAHGKGAYTWANGDVYDGEWKDGKKHGKGVYTRANGVMYDGEWKDGKRHGKGMQTLANGKIYDGEWKGGNQHGKGVDTWANGDVYEGDFRNGKKHGNGVYTRANGDVFEGEWVDNNMHGRCTEKTASGNVYQGEYRDGKKHGEGVYTWASGAVYDGEWNDENPHGKGVFTLPYGYEYKGEWQDGKLFGVDVHILARIVACRVFLGKLANNALSAGESFLGVIRELCEKTVFVEFIANTNGVSYRGGWLGTLFLVFAMISLLSTSILKFKNESSPNSHPGLQTSGNEATCRIVALDEEDITCQLCSNLFSSDTSTQDENTRNRLPVLSSRCGHWLCHGCVLESQALLARRNNGRVPASIPCWYCTKEDAFRPSEPNYHRLLIDLLSRLEPAREEVGQNGSRDPSGQY